MLELSSSRWVQQRQNVILTGHTGLGKSYLACALGQKACRDGFSVVYRRAPRLFDELATARGDGSYATLLKRLAKTNVLILDDFGLEALTAQHRKDLLELLDDRSTPGRPSSPASWSPRTGTPSSAIRPWPTPFVIGSCTTPTASSWASRNPSERPPRI